MSLSRNNINVIICIAMFCGSCINGLHAQEKTKIDVYANLYLSGSATIGNVLEELVAGYHISDNSFVGAGFMYSGVEMAFYGGTLNYSYVKGRLLYGLSRALRQVSCPGSFPEILSRLNSFWISGWN